MPSDKHEKFRKTIDELAECCQRVESAQTKPRLLKRDLNLVYVSSFLVAASRWETLLIETLEYCVCGDASKEIVKRRLVNPVNNKVFQDLLHGGKDYVSIPSIIEAQKIAKFYLVNGYPFTELSQQQVTHLKQVQTIRNAIAHESGYAIKKFRKNIPGVSVLGPRGRNPGPFLRHEFRQSPTQRRIEFYFAQLKSASTTLSGLC